MAVCPLRYEGADRIHMVWETSKGGGSRLASYPTFLDWREQSDVFEKLYGRYPADYRQTFRLGRREAMEHYWTELYGRPAGRPAPPS